MKKLLSLTILCLFFTASQVEAQWQSALQQIQRAAQQQPRTVQPQPQRQPVQPSNQQGTLSHAVDSKVIITTKGYQPGKMGSSDETAPITSNAGLTHARNHVLLMGVTQYPKTKSVSDALSSANVKSVDLADLNFSVKDMEGMKDALVQAHFCRETDIQVLREPTAHEAEEALRKMLDKVQNGDRVLIAFSGHGISLSDKGKTMDFMCFTDTQVTYNADTRQYSMAGIIPRSRLEERLDANNPDGYNLVFIDACRNNPDDTDVKGEGVKGAGDFGIGDASDVQNRGFFRFASCKPGEVSWEDTPKEHSIFTYYLIEGMLGKADKDGSGVITLEDLQVYVVDATKKFVKDNNKNPAQTPDAQGSSNPRRNASHVNFSFVPTKEEQRAAALRKLDTEMEAVRPYVSAEVWQPVVQERQRLSTNFTQQGYQNVVTTIAEFRMQIEYIMALEEWEQKNPPPTKRRANRDGLRRAGMIAGIAMSYAGVSGGEYVQMGTQIGAAALEQRDETILRQQQAQHARRAELMRENLEIHAAETGSPLDFLQTQEERVVALAELENLMKPYRNRQGGSILTTEIANLRNANSRGIVSTSQIVDLKQRVEDFVAAQQASHQANETKLAELEEWLTEHQNQSQTYRNLVGRIASLRTSNNRGTDVTAQVTALEKDIERFIAAPNQPVQQQRQTTQPGRRR